MKILLAVVMSLTLATSAWAVCDVNTPGDCKADKQTCEDAGHVWKIVKDVDPDCVKKADVAASQDQKKACDQIVGTGGVGAKAPTAAAEGTEALTGKTK